MRWADRRTQALNIRDPEGRSAKIRAAKQNITPETRAKISAANSDPSPETRAKLSKPKSAEHCAKIGAVMKGMVNALNIETQEVKRIPKDLFYSRRDIYFTSQSKVFKEWKKNYTDKV